MDVLLQMSRGTVTKKAKKSKKKSGCFDYFKKRDKSILKKEVEMVGCGYDTCCLY